MAIYFKKRISILLLIVIAFGFCSCTKSKTLQNNSKDSVQITLLSSVSYYDEINQIYIRKDSVSYDQNGQLLNWIYSTPKTNDTLSPTYIFSFVGNQINQISSYTVTSYDNWGSATSTTYALTYDAQNRLSGKTASPPGSNPQNDFNVKYQYDGNNIFYIRISDPAYLVDTMTFQNNNMVFRAHAGVGEGYRGQIRNQEYLLYSSYPNPFYNTALNNYGSVFFTCLLNVSEPEFDYLADVLSSNMIDSLNFTTYLGSLKRDRGYYKFDWTADGTGKIISGEYSSTDTTSEYSGYEAIMLAKCHLDFRYKTIWVIK